MAEIIVMPQLGRITSEAVIRQWMVDVGDEVHVGEVLCEIETDKAEVEYESPFGGVVLARLGVDVRVPVGEPIAIVGETEEDISALPSLFSADAADSGSTGPGASEGQGTPQEQVEGRKPKAATRSTPASPLARRLAGELGLDLATVTGTGPGGRITRTDVLAASDRDSKASDHAVPEPSAEHEVKASRMWVAIAEAMARSASIPQFALERDVDVSGLFTVLEDWRAGRDEGSMPTIGDAVICAVARAIRSVPVFLRSYKDKGIFAVSQSVNLGIAVAVPDGLVVPVLNDADLLDTVEVAYSRRQMQERARRGELSTTDVAEPVFSVSNLGPMGVHRFHPLINPPESGILGIGAPSPASPGILTLTLVADHRVVNGAEGAELLAELASRLEDDEGLASIGPT